MTAPKNSSNNNSNKNHDEIKFTTLNIPGVGEVEIPTPPRGENLDYYLVDPDKLTIRERIRRSIRQICNTENTDSEFAERIGSKPSYVCNWMRGKCAPELEMIEKIAKTYNVSMDDMFAGTACTKSYPSQRDANKK